ncbi:hypothetical protein QJS10_CPB13g00888 [Acorus calamus]|uniref:Uncharacterized protein n=1 Tax=Acorus calamus TaxID=4465 RepID=A0AAV9DGG8_ACOCL|nr:hypothetical protein QJS10_CPB13g00888 [Acorus calamus]
MSVLLRLQEDVSLDIPLTRQGLWDLFFSSNDTAAVTLMWVMMELISCLRPMRRLQCELRNGA